MTTADFRSLVDALSTTGTPAHSTQAPVRRVAVLGAGAVGRLIAASALAAGLEVTLHSVYRGQFEELDAAGGITVRGTHLVGTYAVGDPTPSEPAIRLAQGIDDAVAGADAIFVATPSSAHSTFASMLAGILEPGTLIVLVPGRFLGVAALRHELIRHRCASSVTLAELSTPPYLASSTTNGTLRVHAVARHVAFATLPLAAAAEQAERLTPMLPMLTPVDSPLVTAFANVAGIVGAVPLLTNARAMDPSHDAPWLAKDLVTPALAATLLRQLDTERLEVAFRYGVRDLLDAGSWLRHTYGTDPEQDEPPGESDLSRAFHDLEALDELPLGAISEAVLTDEIPDSLVPLSDAAREAGVPTPATDTVISLASCLFGSDQRSVGRSLKWLGLAGIRPAEAHRHLAQLATTGPTLALKGRHAW